MADEKPKKVKVTLKVPMSESEVGTAAKAGDTVEVPPDVAERWVAAGIAETARAEPAEAEKPPAVPRRSSS